MAIKTLINAQTDAATTGWISISKAISPVCFVHAGLASGESIIVEQLVNGTSEPVIEGGVAVALSKDNESNIMCEGPIVIRLVKGVTAGATSVDMIDRYATQVGNT